MPAISGDGRYALIPMPPREGRQMIGLVSMRDGSLLQALPGSRIYSYSVPGNFYSVPGNFGFFETGTKVWVSAGTFILTYDLDVR